jgi:hypothetical protein
VLALAGDYSISEADIANPARRPVIFVTEATGALASR